MRIALIALIVSLLCFASQLRFALRPERLIPFLTIVVYLQLTTRAASQPAHPPAASAFTIVLRTLPCVLPCTRDRTCCLLQRGNGRADCWGLSFLCGLAAPIEPRKRPGSAAKVLLDVFRVIDDRGAGDTGATAGARRRM